MNFETLNSQNVYTGRIFLIRQDRVRYPDGRETNLDILQHPGAVTILPVDEKGNIWFVRQYRHATGKMLLELPAGTLEKGEDPKVCANREIREEIGMRAGKLQKIGAFYLAPGYSTEYMHIYLATQLSPGPLSQDADEYIDVETIPAAEVFQKAHNGQIQDAKSLAALFLAEKFLDF